MRFIGEYYKTFFRAGESREKRVIKKFLKRLGPGFTTGASDDDPSGILTYLQGGAMLGFGALWTALATLPMMYGIQEMSGRIGLVTEKGLIRIIKERYPKYILFIIAFISTVVITINIGADLLAVGVAVQGLVSVSMFLLLPLIAAVIILGAVFFSYRKFAHALMWLTLALFFYVLAVLYINIDWFAALESTLIPNIVLSKNSILILAAIFGTTVSPYLFFWQANQEVEEKQEKISANGGKVQPLGKILVTKNELKNLKEDTLTGMFLSNAIMWFIIAGSAELGKLHGIQGFGTFAEASSVLKPLLGKFAYLAFSAGIIGTGLLAIPVLAGNIGYMFAEIFNLPEGMNKKFHEAKGFYAAIIAAVAFGMFINFFRVDPVTLLIYTAVFYTFITPPIIYIILKIANNRAIMKNSVNSKISNIIGWITFAVSLVLLLVYVVSLFK